MLLQSQTVVIDIAINNDCIIGQSDHMTRQRSVPLLLGKVATEPGRKTLQLGTVAIELCIVTGDCKTGQNGRRTSQNFHRARQSDYLGRVTV